MKNLDHDDWSDDDEPSRIGQVFSLLAGLLVALLFFLAGMLPFKRK